MNKQQQIREIADIIEKRVGTNLGQIQGTRSGFGERADVTTTVSTLLVAEAIINAGYGDVRQSVKEFANRLKLKPLCLTEVAQDCQIDTLFEDMYGE